MKQLSTFFLFLLLSCSSFAQQIDVLITDATTNEPLPYVTVYLKRNGIGTTTNLDGEARLSIADSTIQLDTLVCSYMGYDKKRIPVKMSASSSLEIKLESSFQNIDEVTIVVSKKTLSAKQIIKKALKNTSNNYANSPVNLIGLYRETFKEDNQAIYLNEAAINVYYGEYPQGRFQRRDWEDWYNDDRYAFEITYSQFDGFPNQFNSKDDRAQLLEARSTENWSKYGFKGSIIGGPLSITSKDYPKYQSDFLDKANFNKYAFEKVGLETVDGKKCYVIHFYPIESNKKMSIAFGKKLNRSVYVGKIYVHRTSFAIAKMEFQLAQNVDFGYYQKFVPLDYSVKINYKEQNGTWSLNKITLKQLRSYGMRIAGHKVLYESTQELFITDVLTESVAQIPLDSEWKHTRATTLRDFESPYHPEYWANYTAEKAYPPIPESVKLSLTSEQSLEQQFQGRFKQKLNQAPPFANKIAHTFHYPNDTLTDHYQWFSSPSKSAEFYEYIESENKYAENYIISSRQYQKKFFNSLNNFYPEDTTKFARIYSAGQIVLDEDSLENLVYYEHIDSAQRTPVFNRSQFESPRPNCFINKIKFTESKVAVLYTLNGGLNNHLVILNKGDLTVQDSLNEIYSYEWLNDSILFYTQNNSIKRSDKLFQRNVVNRESTLLKTELDLTYDIAVSKSETHLFCIIESKNESEIYALEKSASHPEFELIIKREKDVYHQIKEFGKSIYSLTNQDALNNRILVYENEQWKEVVPHLKETLIHDFVVTEKFIVLNTFNKGKSEIIYRTRDSKKWTNLELPSDIHSATIRNLKNDTILINYSTPRTPFVAYKFHLKSEQLNKVHSVKIKRQFEYATRYIKTERLWAKSNDGTKIPITLSKSTVPKRKHKGLILKVYGCYGSYPRGTDFSAEDLILMKDGFSIAYAHVRGGLIMGNQWYEEGKLLNKENTFNDYIACAEYLIKKKYTDANHLVGYGQSAGGLVMGVVINRRPELFNTVILDHAYIDPLTTMMNDTLPLTTDHYKELGNPRKEAFYPYMKAYSPYHNISAQNYPNLLFIGSSNDYQTPNWQIAKCVAKLREMDTGETTILFKTDIGSGHMGSTNGDQWIRDLSFMYAFIYGNLFNE